MQFWVEKTYVASRSDRQQGEFACGSALWSPQAGSDGRDTYRLMREVKSGDLVFHFIDKTTIAGVSQVLSGYDDNFIGVSNTEWEGKPAYLIRLTNYTPLTPPISRSEFLDAPQYRSTMLDIVRSNDSLFFDKHLHLRQGAYLTIAPLQLLKIWDEVHFKKTRNHLPLVAAELLSPAAESSTEQVTAVQRPASEHVPTNAIESTPFFSELTFKLLALLHEQPTKASYSEHREAFKSHLERPFETLFREVAIRLPIEMAQALETEKRLLSRILKNDYGVGGAWDFYWGAFYPKGGKRTEDAQLFIWINHERIECGFFVGNLGKDQRQRLASNLSTIPEDLAAQLSESLNSCGVIFGGRDDGIEKAENGPAVGQTTLWTEWIQHFSRFGPGVRINIPQEQAISLSRESLADKIADLFQRLFPLFRMATQNHPFTQAKTATMSSHESFAAKNPEYKLSQCAAETGFAVELLQQWVSGINRKGQAIVYGAPGTGKTFVAEKLARHLIGGGDGICDIVQFHPAYAYEDFIQGIRPQSGVAGGLTYPLIPGRFLEFCERAKRCRDTCVLIIDEINRANLARVFGELMYLLEYRSRNMVLAGGTTFQIPENVRLIGTMNTADRSTALVDHALRRRFAFISLSPQYHVIESFHQNTDFDPTGLIQVLTSLNSIINDKHYHFGISFFLRRDLKRALGDIWQLEIEPYLEEFFFDQQDKLEPFRWEKVKQKVLV